MSYKIVIDSYISHQGSLQFLGIRKCIKADKPRKILVLAVDIGMHLSIGNVSHCQYMIQFVFAILNLVLTISVCTSRITHCLRWR